MWSQFLFFVLVGFVAASDYGWKSNTEYMYKVRGRTLTGLHEVDNQYSGILLKANLIVRPQENGKLMARLTNAEYSQIHTVLPEGWRSEIPESKLQYQQLPISDKTFEIIMKHGVVRDIIVSQEIQNWEANLLKSVVSQMQLDTQGQYVVKSHVNQLPEEGSNTAVFKTMEDTVTGKYETLYDITPLPEYVLQSQPWLAPFPDMKGDGEFIEIVKSKNFSRGEERVGYYYGFGVNKEWEPNTNEMGDFFLRSSISRSVISGNLRRYTIQSTSTTNKIILSPTLNSEQKGMVVSHLNLTLAQVQPASGQFQQVQQPKHLGNLVYSFNTPFGKSHEARSKNQRQSEEEFDFSSEERITRAHRYVRSVADSRDSRESHEDPEWTQDLPKLSEQPQVPFLPMFIGNKGKSIKSSDRVDIVQAVQKIAEQIGQDIERPQQIPQEKTLVKFNVLIHLTRLMNESEMQKCAGKLYTKEQEGVKATAWYAFRDAVAECGTGPALLTIKEWISTRKIASEEAAEVIATMCQSVRVPTAEYMRTLYNLVTKEEVTRQALLNDTAILSYSSLVRKVFVDDEVAHNEYPVHSFGKLYKSSEGQKFVADEFIPYLKQQLQRAIEKADSRKVLVYIRALGNVAHKKILAVFEPYLEGDKQVSQFQRLQMVIALDKLTQVHPKTARSVLYKIYQNAGEMQVIRCAAVYQLMRTSPPASMLQRMAEYTNVDVDQQVNSCVKSAIESAAKLEGEQFAELASHARSALPLLTQESYGVHQSRNFLRSYVAEELNTLYYHNVQSFGSEDSLFPRGLKYRLVAVFGGVNQELFNGHAMISSIDELTNVLSQQTQVYEQRIKQQKQNFQQAQQNKWSSESIARQLNIETEEREQLEGNIYYQLGGGATRFFSFDNRTIEMLPEAIREIEEVLRQGKEFQYTKLMNRRDMTIAFPTEMSFPFFYELDAPTLLKIQGKVEATAEPQISSGHSIHKPHTVSGKSKIEAVISTQVLAQIGFVAPFDHQKYVSGYEKNVQVYVPIKSEFKVDCKNKQMHVEVQPIEQGKNMEIFHYSTWPYTGIKDVFEFQPYGKNFHTIKSVPKQRTTAFDAVIGKKYGLAFRVQYESEQQVMDSQWFYEQIQRQEGISALMAPFVDETISYTKLSVKYAADMSSSKKAHIRFGYTLRYENEQSNDSESRVDMRKLSELPRESQPRQEKMSKLVSSGIKNAEVYVYDIQLNLDGEQQFETSATLGIARSNVDELSRVLFYNQKQSENKPYILAAQIESRIPNTNGLDYAYALKFDPTSTIKGEIAFGRSIQDAAKLNLKAKFYQSESRREYLQSLYRAHECRREMQQGNKQLTACANMTAEANLMDRITVDLQFDNFSPKLTNATYKLYSALRYLGYYNSEENIKFEKTTGMPKNSQIKFRFEPTFEYVNVSLTSDKFDADFTNIRVNNWAKQIVAVHPVFPVQTRVMSELLDIDTYRYTCVADQTEANTFDNKTYPISLGHAWHVLLQYVPDFARTSSHEQRYTKQQEEQQLDQYAVLVRDSKSGNHKEVRMTIRTPGTQGKLYQIDLTPSGQQSGSGSQPLAKVQVNDKEYQYNNKQSVDIEGGYINFYALPNGEVKVEIRHAFYVIYDGERVKITATHQKLRDAVRGLCGTFSGAEYDDFMTPKNCILRDAYEFASTYALEQTERVQKYQSKAQRSECIPDEVIYANVISDVDAGRRHQGYQSKHQMNSQRSYEQDSCTKYQTQYVEESGRVCFTIRPVPVCKSSCQQVNTIKKSVAVHCLDKTSVVENWMEKIQRGASPDFSNKQPNKTVKLEVPEQCAKY